ncbi:MAG TPA: sigma-70 family RNA polymerase sigma factor [Dehalococcoidia bacterium]|nr:sigma-70 family RNA polymerase sigma factor [Dehalococcoidia bacterium]
MDGPRAAGLPPGAVAGARRVAPDGSEPAPDARTPSQTVQHDERELVSRAQSGDAVALGALYDTHYPRVYGYIRYKLGNQEDAEDLAQETFIRMLDALDRYEQRGAPFRAWLMQIAANLVRDHYRRRGAAGTPIGVDVGDLDLIGEGDPAETMAMQFALEEVTGALPLLTETEREILLLRYAADLSIAETAAAANKTENNVKQLTFKALTKLRKALAENDARAERA